MAIITAAQLRSLVGGPNTDEISDADLALSITGALKLLGLYHPKSTYDISVTTVSGQQAYTLPSGMFVDNIADVFVYESSSSMDISAANITFGTEETDDIDDNSFWNGFPKEYYQLQRQGEWADLSKPQWDIDRKNNKLLLIPFPSTTGYIVRIEYSLPYSSVDSFSERQELIIECASEIYALKMLVAKQTVNKISEGNQTLVLNQGKNYQFLLTYAEKRLDSLADKSLLTAMG